mmetsp:Transcript_11843/g.17275  ORF Transcript_11843/g.17275 Transcript_11843/m.17275 type:complete len:252 (-) Transcript_11843:1821-2576(-)
MSYLFLAWFAVVIIQAVIHYCFIGRRTGKRIEEPAVPVEDDRTVISDHISERQVKGVPSTQGKGQDQDKVALDCSRSNTAIGDSSKIELPCHSIADGTSDGLRGRKISVPNKALVSDNRATKDSTATTLSATLSLTPATATESQTCEFGEIHVDEGDCDCVEEDDVRVYQLLKCYYENNTMCLQNQSDSLEPGRDNPYESKVTDAQTTMNLVYNQLRQHELSRTIANSHSSGSLDSKSSPSMTAMTSVACA